MSGSSAIIRQSGSYAPRLALLAAKVHDDRRLRLRAAPERSRPAAKARSFETKRGEAVSQCSSAHCIASRGKPPPRRIAAAPRRHSSLRLLPSYLGRALLDRFAFGSMRRVMDATSAVEAGEDARKSGFPLRPPCAHGSVDKRNSRSEQGDEDGAGEGSFAVKRVKTWRRGRTGSASPARRSGTDGDRRAQASRCGVDRDRQDMHGDIVGLHRRAPQVAFPAAQLRPDRGHEARHAAEAAEHAADQPKEAVEPASAALDAPGSRTSSPKSE